MSATDPHPESHADGHAHVLPLRTYFAVFGILLGMTGLTTLVAYQDLGFMNTPLALAIACAKALAVILYFMHVRYSPRLVQLMAAAGFVWLLILFALTMSDFVTRAGVHGWE